MSHAAWDNEQSSPPSKLKLVFELPVSEAVFIISDQMFSSNKRITNDVPDDIVGDSSSELFEKAVDGKELVETLQSRAVSVLRHCTRVKYWYVSITRHVCESSTRPIAWSVVYCGVIWQVGKCTGAGSKQWGF